MNSIKQKILKQNPKLKTTSLDHYLLTLKKLSEYLEFKNFNVKYFNDHSSVINFIENESNFALPTKRNYITAILVVLKTNKKVNKKVVEAYTTYHKNLTDIQNDLYSNNVKTEKEELNWISIADIKSKITELNNKLTESKTSSENIDLFQQYLILNLYSLLPPIRNDYAGETLVLKDETENKTNSTKNRIILNDKQFILCSYKTSSSYGSKVIDIPNELIEIIKNWITLRENLGLSTKYLLIKLTNPKECMSKNMLTKTLNKIFSPKKVSTTLLRKIYLSEKYPVVNTYKEMQNDAYIMGHDINTAKLIYSKKT